MKTKLTPDIFLSLSFLKCIKRQRLLVLELARMSAIYSPASRLIRFSTENLVAHFSNSVVSASNYNTQKCCILELIERQQWKQQLQTKLLR